MSNNKKPQMIEKLLQLCVEYLVDRDYSATVYRSPLFRTYDDALKYIVDEDIDLIIDAVSTFDDTPASDMSEYEYAAYKERVIRFIKRQENLPSVFVDWKELEVMDMPNTEQSLVYVVLTDYTDPLRSNCELFHSREDAIAYAVRNISTVYRQELKSTSPPLTTHDEKRIMELQRKWRIELENTNEVYVDTLIGGYDGRMSGSFWSIREAYP